MQGKYSTSPLHRLEPRRRQHESVGPVRSVCWYCTVHFCAQPRWHRFHTHRSLDRRVSPSYFFLVCMEVRRMRTYNKNLDAASPLTLEQRLITQQNSMERSFRKEHWDNKQPETMSTWYRASHYLRPPTGSTAVPAVGRGRSPACPVLPPISREECREPLYCRCIRLSVPCGLAPDRPLGACALRLDHDLSSQIARQHHI